MIDDEDGDDDGVGASEEPIERDPAQAFDDSPLRVDGGWNVNDQLHEEAGDMPAPPVVIDPTDGLPTILAPLRPEALPQGLHHTTLVCMESAEWEPERDPHADVHATLAYPRVTGTICAVVNAHALDVRFSRHEVHEVACAGGSRRFVVKHKVLVDDREYAVTETGIGPSRSAIMPNAPTWRFVRPVRPACDFYRRLQQNPSKDSTAQMTTRFCTQIRSNGGSYMSLRDEAIYACELRSPRDRTTERLIGEADLKRVKRAEEGTANELLDDDGIPVAEGIFK